MIMAFPPPSVEDLGPVRYEVILQEIRGKKLIISWVLHQLHPGWKPLEVIRKLKGFPSLLRDDCTEEEALAIQRGLEEVGAIVTIEPKFEW